MSYVQRRNDLMKEIAGAFSSAVQSSESDLEFTGLSYLGINCRSNRTDDCLQCLQTFLPQDLWSKVKTGEQISPSEQIIIDEARKNASCKDACKDACKACLLKHQSQDYIDNPANEAAVHNIKQTSCKGNCTCSVKTHDSSSTITLNTLESIKGEKIDAQQIANQVTASMTKKYGPSSTNMSDPDLVKLINSVHTSLSQNIQQTLHSIQMTNIDGIGTNVSGVVQDAVIDATMKAVAEACSNDASSDKCSTDAIDKLIQQQIDYLKKEVDDGFKVSFATVWNNIKSYVIITGLFLVFLVILIVVLLVRKAIKGPL